MAPSLFITGASGFIGSSLLKKLDAKRFKSVVCLSRDPLGDRRFRWIKGGLADTELYADALAASDTVVHLAAATGKATPARCFEVNAKGTETLVKACERLKVENFLHVSTIAAKFKRATRYFYAQTKKMSEETVKKSRLSYVILRPTIVLGKGSAAWAGMAKLAGAPVVPVFGDGANAIQPVYVDDVADAILALLDLGRYRNETLEFGGPEAVTMENFLRRVHRARFGKDPKVVHIPALPVVAALSVLERFLYSLLPLNAGQLASFRNDGTIEPNELFRRQLPGLRNIDTMLKLIMTDG